jgi:hypothetical protein
MAELNPAFPPPITRTSTSFRTGAMADRGAEMPFMKTQA